jgi:2-dehydro-3-deoxyglucarate aldolase/4-hydroxy-2-oxoheptanedioate aldolase
MPEDQCTFNGHPILIDWRSGGKLGMPRIKQLLAEGGVVRMFGVGQLISPKLIEIVGEHGGFDALWLDAEHAGITMKEIELATMAARVYGMDHFVRLPATDYAAIMRPLEAGAGGVMVSMVRSPAEAEQAVRWAKFWPRGERGMNGGNRDGRFGLTPMAEYAAKANSETFVGIQIETPTAFAAVAEIAAIPDVDLLFVGPADLSQMLGIPGDFMNPRCLDAIEQIARAAADAGKPWGIVSRGPEHAEKMRSLGCRMFVLGFDIHSFHAGIRNVKERYPGFFPKG